MTSSTPQGDSDLLNVLNVMLFIVARLLITQSFMTSSTPQGDSDLLNVLNVL